MATRRYQGLPGGSGRLCAGIALAVSLAACVAPPERAPGDGPGNLGRVAQAKPLTVRNLPKSRIGNAPEYTVFGQRYAVLETAAGFRESGIASWYGSKFHGRDTASGEPYDMHELTAAHKHLPLPTFVRVTRTDTGQSLVVKVNDRGPFVDDRIIDLSFGAAARLDMLDSGTAPVEIVALSTHEVSDVAPVVADGTPAAPAPSPALSAVPDGEEWIQIGAFRDGEAANAELYRVARQLQLPGRVERGAQDALYRVRLGPLQRAGVNAAVSALASVGVTSYTMVSGARSASVR